MDKFKYLGSNVSSTENGINMCLAKAWTAINRISIIWKSDQSDKIKMQFLPSNDYVNSTRWMHHMDTDKVYREKARQELHKNAMSYIEQIQEATSHETAAVRPPTSHLTNHPNKMYKTRKTLLEKQGWTHKWHSPIEPFTQTCQCWLIDKNPYGHRM